MARAGADVSLAYRTCALGGLGCCLCFLSSKKRKSILRGCFLRSGWGSGEGVASHARSEGLRGALGMARGLVEGLGQVAACQKRPWGLPERKNGCGGAGWRGLWKAHKELHAAVSTGRCFQKQTHGCDRLAMLIPIICSAVKKADFDVMKKIVTSPFSAKADPNGLIQLRFQPQSGASDRLGALLRMKH